MQDMPHNDCTRLMNVPEAAINVQEREMCPLSIHKYYNHHQQQQSSIENIKREEQRDNNNIYKLCNINNDTRNSNGLCKANLDNLQHPNQEIVLMNNSQNFHYHNYRHYHHQNQNQYQYHQHQHQHEHEHFNRNENNSHRKLLRSSEDPLISHGAHTVLTIDDDENPIEFAKCLMHNNEIRLWKDNEEIVKHITQQAPLSNNHNQLMESRTLRSGCSNLTKQQLKVKASMMSAKNREQQKEHQKQQQEQFMVNSTTIISNEISAKQRYVKMKKRPMPAGQQGSIKLRFHHQALPSEYRNHYESMQGRLGPMQQQRQTLTTSNDHQKQKQQYPPKTSYSRNSHENIRSWLQKIAEIHCNATANQLAAVKSDIKASCSKDKVTNYVPPSDSNNNISSNKCKPLKSSISNDSEVGQANLKTIELFSNNYTDLPYMGEITLEHSKPRRGRKPKKADICHLICKNYGSTMFPQKASTIIDFALTGDSGNTTFNHTKANGGAYIDRGKATAMDTIIAKKETEDQPLNLCLRDHNIDTLSLTSCEDDDDITETNSSCPTPITTPSDILRDTMLAANMKHALTSTPAVRRKTDKDDWFLGNSLTSYYQKIFENSSLIKQFHGGQLETIQKDNRLALKIPLPSGLLLDQIKSEKSSTITSQSLSPSRPNEFLIECASTPSSIKSEISLATATITATSIANSLVNSVQPQKRKRSAIYIPPLPADTSSTNPANEVSICKFKFTGGAHPTLQEKKMLSVDAGGNYRYFSGTGDKASRGYEYFPRESLQQKVTLLPGMNVVGEKCSLNTVPSLLESHLQALNENKKSVESNTTLQLLQQFQPQRQLRGSHTADNFYESSFILKDKCSGERDSKKSNILQQHHVRRCMQREKLEKTFKEQGFLIQTQQLQSAQGATYCKFRQLKKFSRYLFRNWKDYLPEELQQQQQQQQQQQEQQRKHHYHKGHKYDAEISQSILSTSLRVDGAQQSSPNVNDTEITKHDLRTSLNFTKSELESLLKDT